MLSKKQLVAAAKEIKFQQDINISSMDWLEARLFIMEKELDKAFNKNNTAKLEDLEQKYFTLIARARVEGEIMNKILKSTKKLRAKARKSGFDLD